MNTSGEAAEQVVRMTLNGVEVAAKLTGSAAKEIAVLLYAILNDQKKTHGKIRLTSMLKSGKELRVFAVQDKDLQKFCEAAKQYGILYCVLKDKNPQDGLTEIMARAEDAAKINHIFERFKLATVDMAAIKTEIERNQTKAAEEMQVPERTAPEQGDDFIDELMKKPSPTAEQAQTQNPTEARNAKSRQSEPTSTPKDKAARGTSEPTQRPSVREELRSIRSEQKQKAADTREDRSSDRPSAGSKAPRQTTHQQPASRKKPKKTKER